jgi:ABC-type siderophore export system fused ATPase/permease subunit
MIVVDIGKHEVIVISKLSADALSPVFVVTHDAKQFMSADRIILQSEMQEGDLQYPPP